MKMLFSSPKLKGTVAAIPSKSLFHRAMIAAAFADSPTFFPSRPVGDDVCRTFEALRAFGATMEDSGDGFTLFPVREQKNIVTVDVGGSGSTLRFLLPLAAARGINATFLCNGRLAERPILPLLDLFSAHGVTARKERNKISVSGRLTPGEYRVPVAETSQFLSGMLLSLPLISGSSRLIFDKNMPSAPYIAETLSVLRAFSADFSEDADGFTVTGAGYRSPRVFAVEGDYSTAAFFLVAGAIGENPVTVTGLPEKTTQGDREILPILTRFGAKIEKEAGTVTVYPSALYAVSLDVSDIPDLFPPLAVLATAAEGVTVFHGTERLRKKESDRVAAVSALISALGGKVTVGKNHFAVTGTPLGGGNVSSFGDHRIAMAAAVASIRARGEVLLDGAEAVEKSYPDFYRDFTRLIIDGKTEEIL